MVIVASIVLVPNIAPPLVDAMRLFARPTYHVRITVVGPQGVPIDDARVWSSLGGETKKVSGGWEIDVAGDSKPTDGRLLIYAQLAKASESLVGQQTIVLASDYNLAATVTLRGEPSPAVSIPVRPSAQVPNAGNRLAVTATQPPNLAMGVTVRASAAEAGMPVITIGDVLIDLGDEIRTASFDPIGNANFTEIPQRFLGQRIRLKPKVPGYIQKWYPELISGNVIVLVLERDETGTVVSSAQPVADPSPTLPRMLGHQAPLEVIAAQQPDARLAEPFYLAVTARGGRGSYSWSFSGLPDHIDGDLQIDTATGLISGKPTEAGQYAFTVRVSDADKKEAQRDFKIAVVPHYHVFLELPQSNASPVSRQLFENVMEPCLKKFFAVQTQDPESEKGYPISFLTWLLVPVPPSDRSKQVLCAFLNDWVLDSCQVRAPRLGYVPLPQPLVDTALKAIREICA